MPAVPTRRTPPGRRALAFLLAVLTALVAGGLVAPSATAAVIDPMSIRFQQTVNGDFVLVGNGVLDCTGVASGTPGTCAQLHAGAGTSNTVNDRFTMANVQAVPALTAAGAANSSSAQVTVPAGARVVHAQLYWSANTGVLSGGQLACGSFGGATRPGGDFRTAPVMIQAGADAPVATVAPAETHTEQSLATSQPFYYSSTADVTAQLAALPVGSPQVVSVGGIWAPQGAGCYAGWTLGVVYDHGELIPGDPGTEARNVTLYDGHVRMASSDDPLSVSFSGFAAAGTGTRAGFTLYEGDRQITGDYAQYVSRGAGAPTAPQRLVGTAGGTQNIGVSRAEGGVAYGRNPATPFTNTSVDVITRDLTNVRANDTQVDLTLGTEGDSYLLQTAVLSVPVAAVSIEKSFDGTADQQWRTAGTPARFTITVRNAGSVPVDGASVRVTDVLAEACEIDGIGVDLAPGEEHEYECEGPAPTAGGYVNTAAVTAQPVGQDVVLTDTDTSAVGLTAIALDKDVAAAAGATGRAGEVVTYTFRVTNTGDSPLTGVGVTDAKAGLSALTWQWPGTAGELAPTQTATATATYTLTQADVDAGGTDNAATAAGTDPIGATVTSDDTTTLPVAAAGALTLLKEGTLPADATGVPGETVGYAFTVTNSGNVTLTDVDLDDPLTGLSDITFGTWPGAPGVLAPGASVRASATYVLTQADVDAGRVANTATATAEDPSGTPVTTDDTATVAVPAGPAIELVKTGAAAGQRAGDAVDYTFRVTNRGNVTLSGVTVTDPLPGLSGVTFGTWPGAAGVLAPGQSVTATASYDLTQADVDAGRVENTATATGTAPGGGTVDDTDTETVTVPAAPALALLKEGALADGATGAAGETATFTFTVTNTGNVTLTGVDVDDAMAGVSDVTVGAWPGTPGQLAPGASVTGTATYALTQADADAGVVRNTATATGTPPSGDAVEADDDAVLPLPSAPALTLTKAGAVRGAAAAGAVVDYTFTVTNSGQVTLTGVTVDDPMPGLSDVTVGTWPAAPGVLTPGQSVTATATYVLTQADVDAGTVDNTATATGATTGGTPVSDTADETVDLPATPALAVVKSGALAAEATGVAGDTVEFTFTATNTGNVTLTDVTLDDPMPGLSDLTPGTWPGDAGVLAPRQSVTATATYVLTQADVDAGGVTNTVVGSAVPPGGGTVPGGDTTTVVVPQLPALDVVKSGTLDGDGAAGDTVDYTFTVTNRGNVTLTGVALDDPLPGLSDVTFGTWPGSAGVLAPGQQVTASASYVLTQDDADAGRVDNVVTATGVAPLGTPVTDTDDHTVLVPAAAAIDVTKSGALPRGAASVVGDEVRWTFVVTNTGAVTLRDVALDDAMPGLSDVTFGAWPGTTGTLRPGQQVTATATSALTQADVDAGEVENTATATGVAPAGGGTVEDSDTDTVPVPGTPGLTVEKVGTLPAGTAGAGDTVQWSFTVTNSGQLTLTGVALDDAMPGLSDVTFGAWPGAAGTLRPGEQVTATATSTLTQAQVDAGSVRNTATATGTTPGGGTTTGTDDATVVVPAAPALALVKSGALAAGATGAAGDTVEFAFTVTNTGNVTLAGVAVADPLPGLSRLTWTWPGAEGVLTPDAQATARATYVLTQADVDAGLVENTATATATAPAGGTVQDEDGTTVGVPQLPGVDLVKSGVLAGDGTGAAGDTVDYTFTVTNTGNVTLTGVTVVDELEGLSEVVVDAWPGTAGVLAPGQQVTARASYVLTQADADAGRVDNVASVTGVPPVGAPVSDTDDETVTVPADAAIDLVKSGTLPRGAASVVGDEVRWTFVVTNVGDQTLTQVAVEDAMPGLSAVVVDAWPGAEGTLLPGEQVTATATSRLTQEHVDGGAVENTATATAVGPGGGAAVAVSDADTDRVPVPGAPGVTLEKTGALAGGSGSAGDTVRWSFTVTNTGAVTLTDVAVHDPMPGLSAVEYAWPGATGVLRPGQSATATATLTLTAEHVAAQSVRNTATVTAAGTAGGQVGAEDSATVRLTGDPLATTGGEPWPLAVGGALLLLAGAAALGIRRRVTAG
ncbi:beta strand repeat-containing protein [Cellulomonas sp. NPDC057328]|uniref:beta strand repeat-containing protein n=1 Tax=Cellulomonas sp. NPDC057328 TaxID=3346101 RepID=UPI00364383A9